MGSMSLAEFRQHCNEWFGDFTVQCGDWEQIASPSLTSADLGDRAGGAVVGADGRGRRQLGATQMGRVFISKNVDAASPTA
jgi:hypothetical protein